MERVASDAQHHTRAESTTGLGEDAEGLKSECVEKLKFNFARFPCGEVYDLFDRSMSMELHKIYRRKRWKIRAASSSWQPEIFQREDFSSRSPA
jgi:hypothetical protein